MRLGEDFFQLTLVTFEFHELVYTNLFPDLGCSQPLLDADVPDDADPSPQNLPLWPQHTDTHGLQKSCGGKGTAWPLSQEESALTLALTGFYYFSRPLTSKMVLLYYAKVCFGWLSFADKGEDVAEYIKEGYLQCKRRNGPNSYVPYLEGLAQILGR